MRNRHEADAKEYTLPLACVAEPLPVILGIRLVRPIVEPETEEVILCLLTSVWRGSPGAGNGTSLLADRRSAPTGLIQWGFLGRAPRKPHFFVSGFAYARRLVEVSFTSADTIEQYRRLDRRRRERSVRREAGA